MTRVVLKLGSLSRSPKWYGIPLRRTLKGTVVQRTTHTHGFSSIAASNFLESSVDSSVSSRIVDLRCEVFWCLRYLALTKRILWPRLLCQDAQKVFPV